MPKMNWCRAACGSRWLSYAPWKQDKSSGQMHLCAWRRIYFLFLDLMQIKTCIEFQIQVLFCLFDIQTQHRKMSDIAEKSIAPSVGSRWMEKVKAFLTKTDNPTKLPIRVIWDLELTPVYVYTLVLVMYKNRDSTVWFCKRENNFMWNLRSWICLPILINHTRHCMFTLWCHLSYLKFVFRTAFKLVKKLARHSGLTPCVSCKPC